jgi:nucleoside-diphosphate-sugar epimerase
VLVTGGTGLLGRKVAEEIRSAGFPVRVVSRRVPAPSRRLAGVEYGPADLSHGIAPELLSGVGTIVHCAAETAGGTLEQRRNSIEATRRLLGCAASAGVRRVIHISSLAVLKPSKAYGRPLDEAAPVDAGNAGRGPYVWGKAESEVLARQLGSELGLEVKVIRPGPLVDYAAFHPPGRLGRELGPFFVAIGPKHAALSVCDVGMAARVIRSFVDDFESAPAVLNLVDAPAPSRRDLLTRYRTERSDLRVIWFPGWLLRLVSASFKLAQRLAGSSEPLDVAAAFAAERYDTTLAARTIRRAATSAAAGAA